MIRTTDVPRSCQCGGRCQRPQVQAQLGDLPDFLTGLSLPVLLTVAVVVYLAIAGPGARARRDALADENERHREALEEIKRKHPRLPRVAY